MSLSPSSVEFKLFFALTIFLVSLKIILIFLFGRAVNRERKENGTLVFNFLFATFILLLCLFISRLFFIYFDFFLTELDSDLYHLYPYIIYWKIGIAISYIGIAILILFIDKGIFNFRLKGLPFITMLIVIIFVLLYPVNTARDFEFISLLLIINTIWLLIIPLIYFYISIKRPEFKKMSLLISFGFIFYGIGPVVINEQIIAVMISIFGPGFRLISYFAFAITKLVGLLMLSYGFRGYSLQLSEEKQDFDGPKIIQKMGVHITRPENLTDEDVAFYREQTVCLVCKNTLRGFISNYICPECRALYCENCARTLTILENFCWSCNSPIDKTKPIKLDKIIEVKAEDKELKHKKK